MILHASCVAVGERAALIVGASGQGKSTLALQMMALGAALVSDDQTQIDRRQETLWVSAPPAISGLIEARGVGLLEATPIKTARVYAVIDMDHTETRRLPELQTRVIAGIGIPCLHKVDSPAFPAAVLQYLKTGRREPS
ncbi:HPr kinase/phosphorylase [Roseobacter cerasinus]|nr:HPr kinase/phosphatase C-terminal domain-containing protein [Roseobacter cerasinus]